MNEIFFNEIVNFVELSSSNINLFSICKDDRIAHKRKHTLSLYSANELTEILNDKQFNNILNRNMTLLHSFLYTTEEYTYTITDIADSLLETWNFTTYEKYDKYALYYNYRTIQQPSLMCCNVSFEDSLERFSYVINENDEVCCVYRVPFYIYWSVKKSMTLKALVY